MIIALAFIVAMIPQALLAYIFMGIGMFYLIQAVITDLIDNIKNKNK